MENKSNFSWKRLLVGLVRLGLTSFFCYQIYLEAGLFTCIFAAVVAISFEVQSVLNKMQIKTLTAVVTKTDKEFELRDRLYKKKNENDFIEEELERRSREN